MSRGTKITPQNFWGRCLAPARGCWIWQGYKDAGGYGRARFRGKLWKASRLAWRFAHKDPGKKHVLHICDVRACINPEHLFLGTNADNVRDMLSKDRQAKGARQGACKLTEKQVLQIRRAEGTQAEMSKKYGVSQVSISGIRLGKTWRHLL